MFICIYVLRCYFLGLFTLGIFVIQLFAGRPHPRERPAFTSRISTVSLRCPSSGFPSAHELPILICIIKNRIMHVCIEPITLFNNVGDNVGASKRTRPRYFS